jgi:hypothetical protein
VGFQQHPCVANVGTTPVYLGSGPVFKDWSDRSPNNANIHLPYVEQKKNIALLMYRPEYTPDLIGPEFANKDVALYWRDVDFDEVRNDNLWLLGRQAESYVAVRRSCIGEIDSVRACPTDGGQTWVIMVGDSGMYGSFNNFQSIISQSQFEENWYLDTTTSQYIYYSKITVDSTTIDYAWGVDSNLQSGIKDSKLFEGQLNMYPNPSNEIINLNLSSLINKSINVKVINMMGEEVYQERISHLSSGNKAISTLHWPEGIYIVTVEGDQKVFAGKVIKQQ